MSVRVRGVIGSADITAGHFKGEQYLKGSVPRFDKHDAFYHDMFFMYNVEDRTNKNTVEI